MGWQALNWSKLPYTPAVPCNATKMLLAHPLTRRSKEACTHGGFSHTLEEHALLGLCEDHMANIDHQPETFPSEVHSLYSPGERRKKTPLAPPLTYRPKESCRHKTYSLAHQEYESLQGSVKTASIKSIASRRRSPWGGRLRTGQSCRTMNDFLVISQHALLMLWTQFELAEFVSTPKMNCVLRRSSNSSMLDSRSWPGGTRRCRTTHLMKHMIITGRHALLLAAAQAHGMTMP